MKRWLLAVTGALLGDSVGVPFEFSQGVSVPTRAQITYPPPAAYPRAHPGAPVNAWSDDGAQLLCLADSLLETGGELDAGHLARKLLSWLDDGRHQAGGLVFDVGGQTRYALETWRGGQPPPETDRCGNGALMRVLPAAFLARDPVSAAIQQGLVTHHNSVSSACCGIYVALARQLHAKPECDLSAALTLAYQEVQDYPGLAPAVKQVARFLANELPTGAGYAPNSLAVVCWALAKANDYVDALQLAIGLGGDTDTHASLVGALAALRFGELPSRWVAKLEAAAPVESLQLLKRLAAENENRPEGRQGDAEIT